MKKKVLAALFTALMVCSLAAGCGSSASAPASAEEKTGEVTEETQTKEGETGAEAAQSDAAPTDSAAAETAPAQDAAEDGSPGLSDGTEPEEELTGSQETVIYF